MTNHAAGIGICSGSVFHYRLSNPDSWDRLFEGIVIEDKVFKNSKGCRREIHDEIKKERPLVELKHRRNKRNRIASSNKTKK